MTLNVSAYDLARLAGQQQAVQDLISEHNRQYTAVAQSIRYWIVAYAELSVSVPPGQPPGSYTASLLHGQDFAPLVVLYLTDARDSQIYQLLPYTQLNTADQSIVDFTAAYSVDRLQVTFSIHTGFSGISGQFTAACYVFNVPAAVS